HCLPVVSLLSPWSPSIYPLSLHDALPIFVGSFAIGAANGDNDAGSPEAAQKPKAAATVDPGITFDWVHVDGPYVAMTFDDGPSAKLTPKLLDLLAAHHIKATFFLIGENAAEHP